MARVLDRVGDLLSGDRVGFAVLGLQLDQAGPTMPRQVEHVVGLSAKLFADLIEAADFEDANVDVAAAAGLLDTPVVGRGLAEQLCEFGGDGLGEKHLAESTAKLVEIGGLVLGGLALAVPLDVGEGEVGGGGHGLLVAGRLTVDGAGDCQVVVAGVREGAAPCVRLAGAVRCAVCC